MLSLLRLSGLLCLLKYADGKLTVWLLHRDWMKLGVKTGELVGIKIDERQGILFQK